MDGATHTHISKQADLVHFCALSKKSETIFQQQIFLPPFFVYNIGHAAMDRFTEMPRMMKTKRVLMQINK